MFKVPKDDKGNIEANANEIGYNILIVLVPIFLILMLTA